MTTFTCRWCGTPAPELAAILAHQRPDATCAAQTMRTVMIALDRALRPARP
jgi:hypothetical protein